MKILYTVLWMVIFGLTAMTQPQISEANLPQPGDQVTIAICSDTPDPIDLNNETGPNFTWDFSMLIEIEERNFNFVSPSSTPWSDEFQNSNLCGINWEEGYSFYHVGSNALTTEGYKLINGQDDTITIIYTIQEQILPLPYSSGTTFSDDFSGNGQIAGFEVDVTGTVDFSADGYGTLILPNATYHNVVRYRIEREQTNSISGFPPVQQSKTQWAWVSADYRFWLLLIEENFDGFSTDYLTWYDKAPLGPTGTTLESETKPLIVYPNPARTNQSIQVKRPLKTGESLQIIDSNGKYVKFTYSNSSVETTIDGLSPGTYLIAIRNEKGNNIWSHKLVVF